jgi:hypothetical protein
MPKPYILIAVGTILTVIGLAILNQPLGIIVCGIGWLYFVVSYLEL